MQQNLLIIYFSSKIHFLPKNVASTEGILLVVFWIRLIESAIF